MHLAGAKVEFKPMNLKLSPLILLFSALFSQVDGQINDTSLWEFHRDFRFGKIYKYNGKSQNGWSVSYLAPPLHFGISGSIEIPLRILLVHQPKYAYLSYLELIEEREKKKTLRILLLNPSISYYYHPGNHQALWFRSDIIERHQTHYRMTYEFGLSLGRSIQWVEDVVSFDPRNNPQYQNVHAQGYWTFGALTGIGYRFKNGFSPFYRYHIGILFPFNHLVGTYRYHELGFRIYLNN